jgi:DHA2 family multidrug resistance protein
VVSGLLLADALLVAAVLVQESRFEYPLIRLSVLARRIVAIPALLISIVGFSVAATSFVLPDHLTRVQGLRSLQIGDALNWIALPQIVLVPLVALLLQRIDALLLLAFGFSMIALGLWIDTGMTHDWVSDDFILSQFIEAVGLAFAVTSLITYSISNITPPQTAATAQIARLIGVEFVPRAPGLWWCSIATGAVRIQRTEVVIEAEPVREPIPQNDGSSRRADGG